MKLFAKKSQKLKSPHYFYKSSILGVWQVTEHACELASNVKGISFLINFNLKGNK